MWHPSKGVIHLEDDLSGNESVDSDVEEVVQWDHSLSSTKTFKTAELILYGRKFESPNLESLQKILHLFINKHTSDYFKKNHRTQLPLRTSRPLARLGGSRRRRARRSGQCVSLQSHSCWFFRSRRRKRRMCKRWIPPMLM